MYVWWWFSCQVMSDSSDPMDCSLPDSSAHGIFKARILGWTSISSRGSSQSRNQTCVSCIAGGLLHCTWSPALQMNSLLTELPGNPSVYVWVLFFIHSVTLGLLIGVFKFIYITCLLPLLSFLKLLTGCFAVLYVSSFVVFPFDFMTVFDIMLECFLFICYYHGVHIY